MKLAMKELDALIAVKQAAYAAAVASDSSEQEADKRKRDADLDEMSETLAELRQARRMIDPDCRHR
jgi:hypothetical protein